MIDKLRQTIRPMLRLDMTVRHALLRARGVKIGADAQVDRIARIERWDGAVIKIGARARIGHGVRLTAYGSTTLVIDDDALLEDGVQIRLYPGASVHIGAQAVLAANTYILCYGSIDIGAHAYLNTGCYLGCYGEITIGDYGLLGPYVGLYDCDHASDRLDMPIYLQGHTPPIPVRIGTGAWLGAKVTVTKGVNIGEGAIIGANAVVTRDIPENGIAVGIPAEVVRYRTKNEKVHRY